MSTHVAITARDVMRAVHTARRVGNETLLKRWEATEPDLTEYLLEELSNLHFRLLKIGPAPKVERQLIRDIENFILVLLLATQATRVRNTNLGGKRGRSTSVAKRSKRK